MRQLTPAPPDPSTAPSTTLGVRSGLETEDRGWDTGTKRPVGDALTRVLRKAHPLER